VLDARRKDGGLRGPGEEHLRAERARFYEVRREGAKAGEGASVAVNVSSEESDLTPFDPAELTAAVTPGARSAAAAAVQPLTPEDYERRQSVWWYLLAAGVILLAIEAVVAGRFPRIAQG